MGKKRRGRPRTREYFISDRAAIDADLLARHGAFKDRAVFRVITGNAEFSGFTVRDRVYIGGRGIRLSGAEVKFGIRQFLVCDGCDQRRRLLFDIGVFRCRQCAKLKNLCRGTAREQLLLQRYKLKIRLSKSYISDRPLLEAELADVERQLLDTTLGRAMERHIALTGPTSPLHTTIREMIREPTRPVKVVANAMDAFEGLDPATPEDEAQVAIDDLTQAEVEARLWQIIMDQPQVLEEHSPEG